eukprot:scaffold23464_cov126-Cylindrotheca_fusiformis.AAC.7
MSPAIEKSSRIRSTWSRRTHLRRLSEENVVANFDDYDDDDTSFESLTTTAAEEVEGLIDTWTPPPPPQQQQQQPSDMEYDEDEIDSYFHSPQYGFLKLNDDHHHDDEHQQTISESGVGTSDVVMDDCDAGEVSSVDDDGSIDIVAEMLQLHSYHQRSSSSSPHQQQQQQHHHQSIPDSSSPERARGERVLVSKPTDGDTTTTVPARLVLPIQELLLFRPSSSKFWSRPSYCNTTSSAYSFFENEIPPEETIQIQWTHTGEFEWVTKRYIHLFYHTSSNTTNQDEESIASDSTAPGMNTTPSPPSLDTAFARIMGGQHSIGSADSSSAGAGAGSMDSGSFFGGSIACDQSCSGRPIMKCKDNIVVVSDNDEVEEQSKLSRRGRGRSSISPPPIRGLLFRLSRRSLAGGGGGSVDGADSSVTSFGMKSSSSQQQQDQQHDDCDMILESPKSVSTSAESESLIRDESPTRTVSTTPDSSVAAAPAEDHQQQPSVPNQESSQEELTLDESPPSRRKIQVEGLPVTTRRLSMKRILQSDSAAAAAASPPPSPPSSTEQSPRRTTTITPKASQQRRQQQPAATDATTTVTPPTTSIMNGGEPDSVTIPRKRSSLLQQQQQQQQETKESSNKASPKLVSELHGVRKHHHRARRASTGNEILQELSKSVSTSTEGGEVLVQSYRKHDARPVSTPDFPVVDPALLISQGSMSREDSPRTKMIKAREGLPIKQLSIKRILLSDSSLATPSPPPSESAGGRTPDSTMDSSFKKVVSKSSSPTRTHRRNSSVGSPATTGRVNNKRRNSSTEKLAESNSRKKAKDTTVSSELPSSCSNQNKSPQEDDKQKSKKKKKPKRGSSKSLPTMSTFRKKSSSKDRRTTRGCTKFQKVNLGPSSSPAESSASSSRKRAKKKKDRPNSDSQLSELKKKKKKKSKRKSTSKNDEAADAEKPTTTEGEQKSSTSKRSSTTRYNKNKRRLQVESNFQSLNDKMSSTVGVGVSSSSRNRSPGPSTAGVRSSLRKSLLQKRKAVLQSRQKLKDTFKRIVGGGNGAGGDDMPVPSHI